MAELGKLQPPYPVDHCANVDCGKSFQYENSWRDAYLFTDLESTPANKLVVFCEDCAREAELKWRHRFMLVPL